MPAGLAIGVVAALERGGCVGAAVGATLGALCAIRQRCKGRPSFEDVRLKDGWAHERTRLMQARKCGVLERARGGEGRVGQTTSPEFGPPSNPAAILGQDLQLDEEAFCQLLHRLASQLKYTQHGYRPGYPPKEKRAAAVFTDALWHLSSQSGPLSYECIEFSPGRTNLKVTYQGAGDGTIAFLGASLDVRACLNKLGPVPAGQRTQKTSNEHSFRCEDGLLLGVPPGICHAALLVQLLATLCYKRVRLQRTIVVVLFAGNEEGEVGIGADALLNAGKLDEISGGPVYWLDAGGVDLCCATTGTLGWTLHIRGQGTDPRESAATELNHLSLLSETVETVQGALQRKFQATSADRARYIHQGARMEACTIEPFDDPSTQEVTVHGRLLISPSHDMCQVVSEVDRCVRELNETKLAALGPVQGARMLVGPSGSAEVHPGLVALEWNLNAPLQCGPSLAMLAMGDPEWLGYRELSPAEHALVYEAWEWEGVAISRESLGRRALVHVLHDVVGPELTEFSLVGSVPHIRLFQESGMDVQLCGFHRGTDQDGGSREACSLEDMHRGFNVLVRLLCFLELAGPESDTPGVDWPDVASGGSPSTCVKQRAV